MLNVTAIINLRRLNVRSLLIALRTHPTMEFRFLSLTTWAICVAQVSAQALVAALSGHQELSKFNSYVRSFPKLLDTLNKINNYTVLAPSNNAITRWLDTISPIPNKADIEAILNYQI